MDIFSPKKPRLDRRFTCGLLILLAITIVTSSCTSEGVNTPPPECTKTDEVALRCFCTAWTEGDYDAMYGLLSEARQTAVTLSEWRKAWKEETKVRGLLKSFELKGPNSSDGNISTWTVEVTYRNNRIATQTKNTAMREGEHGWRVDNGGLAPAASLVPPAK